MYWVNVNKGDDRTVNNQVIKLPKGRWKTRNILWLLKIVDKNKLYYLNILYCFENFLKASELIQLCLGTNFCFQLGSWTIIFLLILEIDWLIVQSLFTSHTHQFVMYNGYFTRSVFHWGVDNQEEGRKEPSLKPVTILTAVHIRNEYLNIDSRDVRMNKRMQMEYHRE